MMTFTRYLRDVSRNIRFARARTGMTQQDVSARSGLSYRHYQNIEAGRVNITLETLFRLSRLYKISVQDLVRGE